MPFSRITVPTLLLDEQRCRDNIARMAGRARTHGVRLRPHFKTHQSRLVASWFRDEGVDAITVSSLTMARYFADDGWDDITVAFPVNLREIAAIDELSARIRLQLLVVSSAAVRRLGAALSHGVGVFVKVDTGYGRTGIPFSDQEQLDDVVAEIDGTDALQFSGLLTHAGESYQAAGETDVRLRFDRSRQRLVAAADRLRPSHPDLVVSAGDTPGCSLAESFAGIDEIRPGNFVFYDVMQAALGSCAFDDIAVAAACPVVAVHPERNEAIIYGGSVHLSKESVVDERCGTVYGRVALLTDRGWSEPLPDTWVRSLSQEHGIIRSTAEIIGLLGEGTLIAVLPVHSCLTADCLRSYLLLDGRRADHCAAATPSTP